MQKILQTLMECLDTIDASINGSSTSLTTVEEEIKSTIEEVNTNSDGIDANKFVIDDKCEISNIRNSFKILEDKLDDQIDHNMQETLVIHGIKGTEKTWEETKNLLCGFLKDLSKNNLDPNHIYQSIVRAYRAGVMIFMWC